ncbi:MAG: dihydroneopterin aldolase [Gammaproteobacteria bacterium]|nr:dihydroneopterin aldolase [Gammaproteobacteria bacterium]
MDLVFIRDLEIECIVGIWGWERKMQQTVKIDLDMGTDLTKAAETEDIQHCIDYKSVSQTVTKLVQEGRFMLVETLADRVAAHVREDYSVPWVRVRVSKPGAVKHSREVGVIVERGSKA